MHTQYSIGSKTPGNANRTIRAVQITIQTHKYSTRASLRMHVCVYVSNSFAVMRFTPTVTSLIFCCCSPARAPFEPPPALSCAPMHTTPSSRLLSIRFALFPIFFSFSLLFLFTRSVRQTLFDLIWIVMERQSRRVRENEPIVPRFGQIVKRITFYCRTSNFNVWQNPLAHTQFALAKYCRNICQRKQILFRIFTSRPGSIPSALSTYQIHIVVKHFDSVLRRFPFFHSLRSRAILCLPRISMFTIFVPLAARLDYLICARKR